MLININRVLQQLLNQYGLIGSQEVDISVDAPTKDWAASLTRPAISLFLFDVQENTEKRETNMQSVRANGKAERRLPPRRFDLHYMVSAISTEIEDEHELLWRVLATLMKYQQLPVDVLPEALQSLEPPISTRIGEKEDSDRLLEIWNAFGAPPRPALCYIVTVPLDLDLAFESPLVLTRTARYRSTAGGEVAVETGAHIGGVVRNHQGQPMAGVTVKPEISAADGSTTNEQGQFVLMGVPNGPVKLIVLRQGQLQKRIENRVPAESYDITLD